MEETGPPIATTFSFKGGVGKTTITANLASTMAAQGWRVLLVDGDPQANLTGFITRYNKGAVREDEGPSDDAVQEETQASNAGLDHVSHLRAADIPDGFLAFNDEVTACEEVGGLPSSHITMASLLAHAKAGKDAQELTTIYGDPMLIAGYFKLGIISGTPHIVDDEDVAQPPTDAAGKRRVGRLREYIKVLGKDYDVVLIDLPPAVSNLNKLFMVSSDHIIMPVKPDNFSGDTLWQLFKGEPGRTNVVNKLASYLQAASYEPKDPIQMKSGCLNGVKEFARDGSRVYARTIKFFPLLLNMAQMSKGKLSKFSSKWLNGYNRLLNDPAAQLPSGFEWLVHERRILGAFIDCNTIKTRLQIEKLPVALTGSSEKGVEIIRGACQAVCNLLIKAELPALRALNPYMSKVFEYHDQQITDRCRLRHLMQYLEPSLLRTSMDQSVIDAIVKLVRSEHKLQTSIQGASGISKKARTFSDILFRDIGVGEVELCEHMSTFSKADSSSGWTIKFDGTKSPTDCSVMKNGVKKAAMEVKFIETNAPRDFGRVLVDRTRQMSTPFGKGQHAYGLVFEKNVENRLGGSVKTAVLFKMVKDREKPQIVCFIPCWRLGSANERLGEPPKKRAKR